MVGFLYLCFPVSLHLSDEAFERLHGCEQSVSFFHPALDVELAALLTFRDRKLGQRQHLHALLVHLTEQHLKKTNTTQKMLLEVILILQLKFQMILHLEVVP